MKVASLNIIVVFMLLFCLPYLCYGYRNGDLVRMSKRSRYSQDNQQEETTWSEIQARLCPRFRAHKTVTLPNPLNEEAFDISFDYKLSFSFADNNFITPWMTVWDGEQRRLLNSIEFIFIYSGNEIKEVKYDVDYNDGEHEGNILDHIYISYVWEEFGEQDIELGLVSLLVGGFLSTAIVVAYIIIDVQIKMILSQQSSSGSQMFSSSTPSIIETYDFPTLGVPFIPAVQPQVSPYYAHRNNSPQSHSSSSEHIVAESHYNSQSSENTSADGELLPESAFFQSSEMEDSFVNQFNPEPPSLLLSSTTSAKED